MAKTHEEEKSQRQLTPEEAARRKAALEKPDGDPLKLRANAPAQTTEYGGPVESYEQRLATVATTTPPQAVDYDRDGYPDALVGRSGRHFNQRRHAMNNMSGQGQRQTVVSTGAPGTGAAGVLTDLGADGYRQDQIGYRDRLRVRLAVANQLAENGGDEDGRVRTRGAIPVRSHGGTGVPGGLPSGTVVRPDLPRGQGSPQHVPTPLEQAVMAPRTPATGFANPKGRATGVVVPPMVGPDGVQRQGSFGSVPAQGTLPGDGTFVLGTPPVEDEGGGRKHEHAKAIEPNKPHEPHKPEPHKPHDHGKHPEHHGKK